MPHMSGTDARRSDEPGLQAWWQQRCWSWQTGAWSMGPPYSADGGAQHPAEQLCGIGLAGDWWHTHIVELNLGR